MSDVARRKSCDENFVAKDKSEVERMIDLSVIILTKDEKLHIARCLERLMPLYSSEFVVRSSELDFPQRHRDTEGNSESKIAAEDSRTPQHEQAGQGRDDVRPSTTSNFKLQTSNYQLQKLPTGKVFVVDSCSTDGTQEIARSYGAEVVEHAWPGCQAKQFNWALDNLPIKTKWVLRLDADEYLYPDTIQEVKELLELGIRDQGLGIREDEITSLSLSRARAWQGRIIKRGTGKVILKRFFRYGVGRCEERYMDEHIVTSYGKDYMLKGQFVDDNLNDLRWWTEKHLDYAEREACDLLQAELEANSSEFGVRRSESRENSNSDAGCVAPQSKESNYALRITHYELSGQAASKRRLKGRYARLPLFWRAFAYFCYRYFLRGGFLEGKAGFTWHFFQGWWYRTMVDARIWEIKKLCNNDPEKIREYLDARHASQ